MTTAINFRFFTQPASAFVRVETYSDDSSYPQKVATIQPNSVSGCHIWQFGTHTTDNPLPILTAYFAEIGAENAEYAAQSCVERTNRFVAERQQVFAGRE
ncbi:hypothetical protein [Kingella negevensis]|uniref:Uncharacterized protein n=1 Tax=Kingella negevensis TaxID=1522312 RepID=A0A238HE90_9NEIS|nr:hypothetical protein [Kingella negevensis]MDK4681263.1 hypothetical protein [Kingella negevensis]MDK4683460.1 hypothetical protein [Kingella negevensis]MDK4684094.1 hypothetical protein [Kingella negevensis]MDK4689143.1 hypothetical protein [Kingella negevensis]MDK4691405.1 hypothetical protein [Kingella negevensis]